jgi:hypothetical protein
MSFPAGLTLVTVHCRLDLPPSGGSTGTITFTSQGPLVGAVDNSIVPPFDIDGTLVNGQCTVQLPATNDPDWTPVGWSYLVQVVIANGVNWVTGTAQFDYQVTSVELADVFQPNGAALPGVSYVPSSLLSVVTPSGDVTGVADTAAIQGAENGGRSMISLAPGIFYVTGLTKNANTVWQGSGRLGTTIKLADNVNAAAVITTAGFNSLTGTGVEGGPGGWGIRDLTVDGNKANQTVKPDGIRLYGYNFDITDVSFTNVAKGMYTEWRDFGGSGIPGKTMESRYLGVKINAFDTYGWQNRGPHDSRAFDLTIFGPDLATAYGYWGQESTGLYSSAGTQIIGGHVWGSPLWDWVLDSQTHLFECISEVSAPGGGQVLIRANLCQVNGGVLVIYQGFTADGCGIQLGDLTHPVSGVRVDTTMLGFTGVDAAHAAINVVNDAGSNAIDATVYQPTGTALWGTPNTGFSRYRIAGAGAATRGANAAISLQLLLGRHVFDIPAGVGQAFLLTSNGSDVVNVNTASNRLEIIGGMLARMYSDPFYSTPAIELDSTKGHINIPAPTTAPGVTLGPAIGTSGNGASVTVSGNDMRGTVSITTASTGVGTGTAVTLTFASSWGVTPAVSLTPVSAVAAARQAYAQAISPTQALIGFGVAPAISTTYVFAYQVLG